MLPIMSTNGCRGLVRRHSLPVVITLISYLSSPFVHALLLPTTPGAVRDLLSSSPATTPAAGALFRGRNMASPDICGWFAGEDGFGTEYPLRCSSGQSFCALVRSDIVGCCSPEAQFVGTAGCDYFTACYPSSAVDDIVEMDERVQICTSTESECVTWAFEIDGTVGPSSFGCAISRASIVVKTTASSDALTAPIPVLSTLDQNTNSHASTTRHTKTMTDVSKPTTSSASSPSPTSGEGTPEAGTNIGAIVGGAVGGVLFLLVVIIFLTACLAPAWWERWMPPCCCPNPFAPHRGNNEVYNDANNTGPGSGANGSTRVPATSFPPGEVEYQPLPTEAAGMVSGLGITHADPEGSDHWGFGSTQTPDRSSASPVPRSPEMSRITQERLQGGFGGTESI